MTKLQALIFDVDGTLADTERYGHRIAFNRAFAESGLDWEWDADLYGKLLEVAGGKERINFYLNRYNSDFQAPINLDIFIANLHALKTKHYQELLSEGAIPLRLGVKRLIQEAIAHNIRLAIATTSALPNATALLEKHLDISWFEIIAAGDIVPAKKPAPDIYYYVLDKMGLKATDCLVFEDSHHGLQAATQAGLKTIVTVNEYTKNQDFHQACLVVSHLGEINQTLQVISGDIGNSNYVDLALLNRLHSDRI